MVITAGAVTTPSTGLGVWLGWDPVVTLATPGMRTEAVVFSGLFMDEWTITTNMVGVTAAGVVPAIYGTRAIADIGDGVGGWYGGFALEPCTSTVAKSGRLAEGSLWGETAGRVAVVTVVVIVRVSRLHATDAFPGGV